MAKRDETEAARKKRPHSASDFQALEDKLVSIAQRIREIRADLQRGPMDPVELMTGTFAFRLDELEAMSLKIAGDFQTAKTIHAQEAFRNRTKNERKK